MSNSSKQLRKIGIFSDHFNQLLSGLEVEIKKDREMHCNEK